MKIIKMLNVLIGCLALAVIARGEPIPGSVMISIDCGAPDDYHDDQLDLDYKTDRGFVDFGTNSEVSTQVIDQDFGRQSKNLRFFTDGARNCYTFKPDEGQNNTYLIRAVFVYGDYDNKNQPPGFDLYIDVYHWTTVNTSSRHYEEIIYTLQRDYIQVCLVNTGSGVPFISALELRLLDDETYQTDSGALLTKWRYNLGSTDNDSHRHPQDVYDRIWKSKTDGGVWSSVSNTTAIVISTSNDDNSGVPTEVLMTAVQVQNVTDPLRMSWESNDSTAFWHVYFHFAELQLQKGLLRELAVYVQDESVNQVILENQESSTIHSPSISGQHLNFTVNATARSGLPPLLNAVEFFTVLQLQNSPTYLDDYNAMYDVKQTYGVITVSWQGDPCVPSQYAWNGVNCSADSPPRIIKLNLSSSGLKGLIAQSISNLTALVSLDLSNNSLTGSIPELLAQMPSLKVLNLSANNLNGSIPQTLLDKKADQSLLLSLDGNPNLCQSDKCQTSSVQTKKKGTSSIIALVVGILVLISLGALVARWIIRRMIQNVAAITSTINSEGSTEILRLSKNRPFTSTEVTRITDNFITVIGEGAFGKVYFGRLDDGTQVAVKMLSRSSKQGYKEFHAEAKLLMVVHHTNLVSLIGYCQEPENLALIYEFMSGGNVRQHLSAHNPNVLKWSQRLQIAIDAAQGLDYLHNGCKPPIIHRDLKTANILLNEDMQAKICDFGLSKAFATAHDSHISTCPAGTPGYLDPESHINGSSSQKSDVYSFGIVLFELITGHPAVMRRPEDNMHILDWVTPLIERGDIQSIVDPRLNDQYDVSSAWKAVEIAMSCVPTKVVQRPDISRVLSELKECLTVESSSGRSLIMRIRSESFERPSMELAPSAR